MTYFYLDASREGDPDALTDVEVFGPEAYGECDECTSGAMYNPDCTDCDCCRDGRIQQTDDIGYFYAYGSPGCLWESDPVGPFDSEAEALKAAREAAGFCEHGIGDETPCTHCDGRGYFDRSTASESQETCRKCDGSGSAVCEACPAPEERASKDGVVGKESIQEQP